MCTPPWTRYHWSHLVALNLQNFEPIIKSFATKLINKGINQKLRLIKGHRSWVTLNIGGLISYSGNEVCDKAQVKVRNYFAQENRETKFRGQLVKAGQIQTIQKPHDPKMHFGKKSCCEGSHRYRIAKQRVPPLSASDQIATEKGGVMKGWCVVHRGRWG